MTMPTVFLRQSGVVNVSFGGVEISGIVAGIFRGVFVYTESGNIIIGFVFRILLRLTRSMVNKCSTVLYMYN